MRSRGVITSWDDARGFGFIKPSAGGKDVFVHIKALSNRGQRPEINQSVTYAMSTDRRGRPCADQVTLAGDKPQSIKKGKSGGSLQIIAASLFLVIVAISVIAAKIPPSVLFLYLGVSPVTFIAYALDKSAARTGRWRTSESTLHLLSLAGGWPGAVVAQQKLRHKSRKQPFREIFWGTVLLNCGVFLWLFTPPGSAYISGLQ